MMSMAENSKDMAIDAVSGDRIHAMMRIALIPKREASG